MYIVIGKHEEAKLYLGDKLRAIDVTDERQMGTFTVMQEREHDYYALGVEVDPNWLGLVHQCGLREQYPRPNVVARLMQRSAEDG